jgi:protein-L-isoaspartate(D-aspartate) O-methyltransferase
MTPRSGYAEARRRLVREIARQGISDPRVLAAIESVPRERFVAPDLEPSAYEDAPLPIGEGQTISQPYVVALMAEAAAIQPSDRVLEIGAGSGYAAAVLAHLAAEVYTVERIGQLARRAAERLRALGYDTIHLRHADGVEGWAEAGPFDAILVAAAGPRVPDRLLRQLKTGGRLVMPVGPVGGPQSLVRLVRRGAEAFERTELGQVAFVPLIAGTGPSGEAGPGEAGPDSLGAGGAAPGRSQRNGAGGTAVSGRREFHDTGRHLMSTRTARAEWQGNLREGHGTIAVGSGSFSGVYGFQSRFEEAPGTNPEELIGAAHAGCFSMALAAGLTKAGHPPLRVTTTARVHLDKVSDGFEITRIELETEAEVPGIDAAEFQRQADGAKSGCPVSKALKGGPQIDLRARLVG